MKKLFIYLLLLTACKSSYAQIKTSGFVEVGYLNETLALNTNGFVSNYQSGDVLYSNITLNFMLKDINLETELYNVFFYEDGKTFNVSEIKYRTRVYYKFKCLSLGYEHLCLHPIINQHNELSAVTRRTSHDKVFLRYTFNAN